MKSFLILVSVLLSVFSVLCASSGFAAGGNISLVVQIYTNDSSAAQEYDSASGTWVPRDLPPTPPLSIDKGIVSELVLDGRGTLELSANSKYTINFGSDDNAIRAAKRFKERIEKNSQQYQIQLRNNVFTEVDDGQVVQSANVVDSKNVRLSQVWIVDKDNRGMSGDQFVRTSGFFEEIKDLFQKM
jgi:hypothetical protein